MQNRKRTGASVQSADPDLDLGRLSPWRQLVTVADGWANASVAPAWQGVEADGARRAADWRAPDLRINRAKVVRGGGIEHTTFASRGWNLATGLGCVLC